MNDIKLKTFFAFGAVYIIWGSTYLAIRYAVETIPPFFMMGSRSLLAGLVLYSLSRFKEKSGIKRENLLPLFIIGTLFFLVAHGLLAWSQQYVPSGLAAVLVASEPLWILLLEFVFIRDTRVKLKGIIGLILGFIAIAFLILSLNKVSFNNTNFTGSLTIILCTLSWGTGAVYSRVAKIPKSAALSAGMELIIGGGLLLLTGFLFKENQVLVLTKISARSALSLGYLIIFGSVITFTAYVWLLGRTSATRISTHTYVNPIIAVFLGWIIGGENVSYSLLAATIAIVISIYLVLQDQYQLKKRENII
ncbi:MAG TPA: EamA family transporter [Ignavibacteriaceae bacterium]|nr:EamA family transporter [Ignavibacteriaceae bacterium]